MASLGGGVRAGEGRHGGRATGRSDDTILAYRNPGRDVPSDVKVPAGCKREPTLLNVVQLRRCVPNVSRGVAEVGIAAPRTRRPHQTIPRK